MTLQIPQEHHPLRCKCKYCIEFKWQRPCFDCGMMCHAAQNCPWGRYVEEANNQDDDRIQEAVHDDYLWGAEH